MLREQLNIFEKWSNQTKVGKYQYDFNIPILLYTIKVTKCIWLFYTDQRIIIYF